MSVSLETLVPQENQLLQKKKKQLKNHLFHKRKNHQKKHLLQ